MKKLFLSMIAVLMAIASVAQNTLVATLTHGDNVKMFYGSLALSSAHSAAVSGDVITLSEGTFGGLTISKAITIRGAGKNSTFIKDVVDFIIPETDTCRFSVENISFNGSFTRFYNHSFNATINKCDFTGAVTFDNSYCDIQFANCVMNSLLVCGHNSIKVMHSYIKAGYRLYSASSVGNFGTTQFLNSVIWGNFSSFPTSTFINCILWDSGNNSLSSSTIAMNCVSLVSKVAYQYMQGTAIDCSMSTTAEMFSNTETLELTDEAKEKFLGTDGTEVGLYGGQFPYDPTPSYPLINKMNVSKQTTADGKLSVEIEVSAAEK